MIVTIMINIQLPMITAISTGFGRLASGRGGNS